MLTQDQGTVPLRVRLKALQADLEAAAAEHLAHRGGHACREGSGCGTGLALAARVAEAQAGLGLTRFLNEEG